jgi:Acyl-CoA reductase (LuxC)
MSDRLTYFNDASREIAVALPFDLEAWIGEWSGLRSTMIRNRPEAFTRDEWAYLITFLDPESLLRVFESHFGKRTSASGAQVAALLRPRGPIAIWLPNNVSLLGPLTLILASLSGNAVWLKAGSHSEDLAAAFLEFCRTALPGGPLADYLQHRVRLDSFSRDDPRVGEMAASASVRIVFGSDEAVAAIDALPHPAESISFAFADRRSEAWIEPSRVDDATLESLAKVFAIYGQAGCTSPRRVVLIEGTIDQARTARDRLLALWGNVIPRDPPMHQASANILARQHAAILGWSAELTERHGAVLAVGEASLPEIEGPSLLPFVALPLDQAIQQLPSNIQTIGHAVTDPRDPRWLRMLANTSVKRFVPLARMHHFGPVWDGLRFWQMLFEEVEVAS